MCANSICFRHQMERFGGSTNFVLYGTEEFSSAEEFGTEHAVAQLVMALRYNPEGRKLDSLWCHWKFSLR
jgi:hypothetical protein